MLETPRLCLLLIAVVGLVQGMFLLLLLYQQGKRAFCANRWLFVFIIAVCLSFVEDLADVLLEPSITLYLIPVFLTAIVLIQEGLRRGLSQFFYSGIALVLALAVMRYLDLFGDYLGAAAMFLVAAAVLYGAARYWRRQQRLAGQASGEGQA
ncbi:MAG: hypothetical protein JKY21_03300 [Alcanivorax sp.]|nr:hypothetical protein [Alcanivorax sp.]